MVYGPKPGPGTWLTVGVTAVALCVPLGVVFAAPRLSEPSAAQPTTSQMPATSATPGRLDAQLDSLPIVVTDFPDELSKTAASRYATLRLQQPAAVLGTFTDTWHALAVDAAGVEAVSRLGDYLIAPPDMSDLYIDIVPHVNDAAATALPYLVEDPRNADRLSNAALALFMYGVSWDQTFMGRDESMPTYFLGTYVEARAIALLNDVEGVFPANRAVLLNSAYMTSVIPGICNGDTSQLQTGLVAARKWLQFAPDDATATVLTANLQARDSVMLTDALVPGQNGQPAALDSALATAGSLVVNGKAAALALAVKGDAYLAAASAVSTQAPFEARRYADLARQDYEKALASVNDPGLWAGEASSLSILGNPRAALAAQRAAVSLAPNSAELLIGLALAEERVGDFRGMHMAAEEALSHSLATTNPLLTETRLIASFPGTGATIPGDRGYMGYSFGSDRPRMPVFMLERGCGSGGFTISTDLVPALDDPRIDDSAHMLPLPDAAVLTATASSLVLLDTASAEADVARWKGAANSNPAAGSDELWLDRDQQVDNIALQAVHLVANGTLRAGTDPIQTMQFAESHLRHSAEAAGQVSLYARAADICRLAAEGTGVFGTVSEEDRVYSLRCEGESAYHAGKYASAAAALEKYGGSDIATEAAIALWKSGQPDAARTLLLNILSGQDPKDPAYLGTVEILGELHLDRQEASAAIDYLEMTINGVQSYLQPLHSVVDSATQEERVVAEHAYNNHGVALLWRAQRVPGAAPDCGHENVCKLARDDFAAAISMDPNNPYYLQNAAWADRLLNHVSVSNAELDSAAAADPDDYPVLNDLGVMAAQNGDLATAERELQSSLRAQPNYDLAAWNLGVVDMQLGAGHIPSAQAYLARAISENPDFKGKPLQYQVDNRIYRAAFGRPLEPVQTPGTIRAYSDAAVGTGVIGAISALGDAVGIEFRAMLRDVLEGLNRLPLLPKLISRMGVILAPRRIGQRLPAFLKIWLLTGLVLVVGTIWTVSSRQGLAGGAELAIALVATGIAVLVHECGHLIAACMRGVKLEPDPSPLGITMSVLLMPLHLSSGPYAGHRVLASDRGQHGKFEIPHERARWACLAGPIANILVAALAAGLYFASPLPFLLLLASVQLAAASFSLLPFEPLDDANLSKSRPHHSARFSVLAAALALISSLGAAAIATGRL